MCTRCYVWHHFLRGLEEKRAHSSSVASHTVTPMDIAWIMQWCLTKYPATHKLVITVIQQPCSGGTQVCHHNYELCGPCALSSVISCERPYCYECVAFFFSCGQGKENNTSHEYLWRMTTKKVFSGIRYIFIPLKCVCPFLSCSILVQCWKQPIKPRIWHYF